MKRVAASVMGLVILSLVGMNVQAEEKFFKHPSVQKKKLPKSEYVADELLVKFRPDIQQMDKQKFQTQVQAATVNNRVEAISAFHKHYQTRSKKSVVGWDVVTVPQGMTVEQAVQNLKQNALIEDIQPNYLVHGAAPLPTTYTATDYPAVNEPYYKDGQTQWWFNRIRADQAWQNIGGFIFNGVSVTVAVVDSGIDITHSEFSGRWATGYNVITPSSSPDDDNMWEPMPIPTPPILIKGHGTHVAGIIAANLNGSGIAGTAFLAQVKIMPVKVLDYNNSGPISDVAIGIIWAANNGANIINLSLGVYNGKTYTPYDTYPILQTACDYAINNKNCLLIAAAGNNSIDIKSTGAYAYYPASYSNVYAVAAVNSVDHDASYSNWDSDRTQIDFAAPGGQLYDTPPLSPVYYRDFGVTSTAMGNTCSALEGTSFAAPQVSALAALLKLQLPSRTSSEIIDIIKFNCDNPLSLDSAYIGSGRINVFRALSDYKTPTPTYTITPSPTISPTGTISPTSTISATATVTPSVTPTWHGITDLTGYVRRSKAATRYDS
jgi:thermitase